MAIPEFFPYYIVTPDYKTSSLGIQVMHYLCHLINERGHQAWLVNAKSNPEWNTPLLSDKLLNSHREQGVPAISVYPEIVSGNPLKTSVVVRYMLNREGVMNGNAIDAGKGDLFFWYRSEFAEKNVDPLLRLELYDLDLFCDDNPIKDTNLLYLNRIPESYVDFSKLPEDIEILTMRNPLSLEQLAVKLKRARVLYTYESSGTNALAILCGCPVVALTLKGLEKYAITPATLKDTGAAGYAWDDKPATLTRVRETMGGLREQMLERRKKSQLQLAHFIDITQEQAMKCWQLKRDELLHEWLVKRKLPTNHPVLATNNVLPRLMVVIHMQGQEKDKLLKTMKSIFAQQVNVTVLIVVPDGMSFSFQSDAQIVSEEDFLTTFASHIYGGIYDWIQNITAGVTFSSGALAVLLHFLAKTDAHAVAGGELRQSENDHSWHLDRNNPDWELYLRSPHIYMKRWIISCKALAEIPSLALTYSPALEGEILYKLREASPDRSFDYIDDILTLVESDSPSSLELTAWSRIIEQWQVNAGYQQSRVDVTQHNLLKIKFNHSEQPQVSVIILAGEQLLKLQNTITGFLEKNNWVNFELLVVNHKNNSSETNQWLDALATIDPVNIRVLNPDIGNSRYLLQVYAVGNALGDYFLFLDNNLLFVTDDWLTHLMEQAQRADVGFVGPKLINRDQKIVSAGVGFNRHGLAEHIGKDLIWHSLVGQAQLMSVFQPAFIDEHCWLVSRNCWEKVSSSNNVGVTSPLVLADLMFRAKNYGLKVITATDSILVLDGDTQTFTPTMQTSLQLMKKDPLSLSRVEGNGDFTLSDVDILSTAETNSNALWLAQRDAGIPLFITLGEPVIKGCSEQFSLFLDTLCKDNKIRVINCDTVPNLHDFLRWKPDYIIVLGDISLLDCQDFPVIKKECNTLIYRVAPEFLTNKTLSSWLHFPLLDGWLTYSTQQVEWLEKRKQTVVAVAPLFEVNTSNFEGTIASLPLRIVCDMRYLNQREIRFLSYIIKTTSNDVHWLVYGDCPEEWRDAIHEIHRMRNDSSQSEVISALNADVAVFPCFQDGTHRLRDNYGQLLYLSNYLKIICNHAKEMMSDFDALYTTTEPSDWVKTILTIAQEKRINKGHVLHSQKKFDQKYIKNDITVTKFLKSLTPNT